MKIQLLLLLFLLQNINIQAQSKEIPKNSDITIYKLFKSINEKPEYNYTSIPYAPNHNFFTFNLSENKRNALLDSFKANTTLKFIKIEKDKRLRLRIAYVLEHKKIPSMPFDAAQRLGRDTQIGGNIHGRNTINKKRRCFQ